MKATFRSFTAGLVLQSTLHFANAADTHFTSGTFRITSGRYTECCGIAGAITIQLPAPTRALVELSVEATTGLASLQLRGADQQTTSLSLSNGVVTADAIEFGTPFEKQNPGGLGLYFKVTHPGPSTDTITIQGHIVTPAEGADVIHDFLYQDVQAAAEAPTAVEIRVSEIEVCWNAPQGRSYQPQYRSDVAGSEWVNLGGAMTGAGARVCVTDKLLPAEPQRFYRVIEVSTPLPQARPQN